MTVKELRDALSNLPDDALVVLSQDSEGNRFGPLDEVLAGKYDFESEWAGKFFENEVLNDPIFEQPSPDAVSAVCLWPVN